MTVQINKSTCKKFLKDAGIRASPEAVDTFKSKLEETCKKLGDDVARIVKDKKRITAKSEDIVEAFNINIE